MAESQARTRINDVNGYVHKQVRLTHSKNQKDRNDFK